ncbi:MAG: GNAT family N-acetyltransferase [Pseudomonadota bacterium]
MSAAAAAEQDTQVGGLRIATLADAALAAALPDLADLRISVFRSFPYLYDGDRAYETRYLDAYARSAGAVVIGAFDGNRLVGAATAAPLEDHLDAFAGLADRLAVSPTEIFYFGESVLDPAYRGRGVGHAFFDAREAAARAAGRGVAAFCAVIRPDDHPARPRDHQPLDGFWRRRGYAPIDGFTAPMAWRDLGETQETEKPMRFWTRRLERV